ncbi:TRAP transporter substrate-binding protein DctP [Paraburkholderia domus]|uniref:TRAP transporter substrate-binding protein DctP n=1 Tax=Paraburkholderia domus TaxID=2793075 RepID=UPI001B1BE362|nr:TRAP transporter substrate-binding protein DctP [Paraburkholderia domus]CAE6822444.1 Outer membrane transporter protein TsaT [Paraburkholderia domus]
MIKRILLRWGLCALSLCSVLYLPSAWASTTLVINTYLPVQHPINTRLLKPWAADVERVTQGRVKVVFPPASIAAPQQMWEAVTGSVVDGAYIFNGNFYRQLPLMQITHLPLGSASAQSMSLALWETYQDFFKPADEYKDVELLALFVIPAGQIYGLNHPIDSVADLRGKKIWAVPGVAAEVMESAQAGVMSTPAAKMSEIVASGMVDGFAGIPEMDASALKVIRYAKFETVVPGGLTSPSFSLILNKQKWQEISPQDRAAIAGVSGEVFARRLSALDQINSKALKNAEADGLKVSVASPKFVKQLRQIAAPIENAWIERAAASHVDGKTALAFYRHAVEVTKK